MTSSGFLYHLFLCSGELIASAGDGMFYIVATVGIWLRTLSDGMIIIWAPSSTPPPMTYGNDLSIEDLQYEKEYWKPRTTFRSVFDSFPLVHPH